MSLRGFNPVAVVLRAFNAPATLTPVPDEMHKALESIDRLDRLADEKIERVRARNVTIASLADVLDDLARSR